MSDESHTALASRPLRKDAERNRQRILASARVLFAERGVDVGLDEIARTAGVGVGTVYRRFPDRDALIDELLDDKIAEIECAATDALEIDDPWDGLVQFLERTQEMQAADRGLKEALLVPNRGKERLAAARQRIDPLLETLIERAQESGGLRPDVRFEDFALLMEMVGSVSDATHEADPGLWRRYLRIVIDGLATSRDGPSDLGLGPLDRERLAQALCASAR
ncbi:MAG: helix-turn-helix domain-containing protein [Solirubrobacterales bacterium]